MEWQCKLFMCNENIHSLSDWRKALLRKKNELRAAGVTDFESHPEYIRLTQCKQDEYQSEDQCKTFINIPYNPPQRRPQPTQRRPMPPRHPPTERCPKGTRRSKITMLCEPTQRRKPRNTNGHKELERLRKRLNALYKDRRAELIHLIYSSPEARTDVDRDAMTTNFKEYKQTITDLVTPTMNANYLHMALTQANNVETIWMNHYLNNVEGFERALNTITQISPDWELIRTSTKATTKRNKAGLCRKGSYLVDGICVKKT